MTTNISIKTSTITLNLNRWITITWFSCRLVLQFICFSSRWTQPQQNNEPKSFKPTQSTTPFPSLSICENSKRIFHSDGSVKLFLEFLPLQWNAIILARLIGFWKVFLRPRLLEFSGNLAGGQVVVVTYSLSLSLINFSGGTCFQFFETLRSRWRSETRSFSFRKWMNPSRFWNFWIIWDIS